MNAFVKTNNGTFPNVNFYLAWAAFNTMGYEVICFEEKDLDNLNISKETPLFAGVTVFRKVIDKLKVNYAPFNCYPESMTPYYGRHIKKTTLGRVRFDFNQSAVPIFVKPVIPKQFNGRVIKSCIDLIPMAKQNDDCEVFVSEPLEIVSEFRVYVLENSILGVKHYYGDWSLVPDKNFVNEIVKNYYDCPVSYGIDVGVLSDGTSIVIESNDGCNLGNYGLDSIHYGEMIVCRWNEIVNEIPMKNSKKPSGFFPILKNNRFDLESLIINEKHEQ